ncbi:MAG: hypothetical protein AMJ43_08100 [Coxiella sp. DG_40]|nr:MAG: hypothetical protein AMJ43_08100 [Coxiella sp. DG_40]
MNKHFWAFAIIVALCTGFLAGVFLQYHQVPYRIKWSIIYAIQDISGKSRFDYSLPVDPAKLEAFGEPIQVFDTRTTPYVGSTKPESSAMDRDEFLSYRYFWHFKEIADYLVSSEAKQTASRIHQDFWTVDENSITGYLAVMEPKRRFLKKALGIEDLPTNGKVKDRSIIVDNDTIVIEKMLLESRIPAISVPCYVAKPKTMKIKGVVIAIGGVASVPEKVIGIEPRDYTRQFGRELARDGYVVFAPYIINISNRTANISGLGMLYTGNTHWSIDLQKLLSVVDHIKNDPALSELPIATYGISIGGLFAAMLPAVDTRIDIAISSGRLTRTPNEGDYEIEKDINKVNYVLVNNIYEVVCFKYSDYARLIYPRPLVIEMGALDNPIDDTVLWEEIKQIYSRHNMDKNLKLVWFRGFHETAPKLVKPVLNELVKETKQQGR